MGVIQNTGGVGPIKPSDDPLGRGREQVHSGGRFCFLGAALYVPTYPSSNKPQRGTWWLMHRFRARGPLNLKQSSSQWCKKSIRR